MHKNIPLFYFPLNILLIDDDIKMLEQLKNNLSKEFNVLSTDNCSKAEQLIKNNNFNSRLNLLVNEDQEYYNLCNDSKTNITYKLDFKNITKFYDEIKNLNKSIGVVVVDYSMPVMNGIEFCKSIDDYKLKKILLTGGLNFKEAILALNSRIVDNYLNKGEPLILEKLNEAIKTQLWDLFIELSFPLLNTLEVSGCPFINDKHFAKFFQELIYTKNIREYYLINMNWNFLMIDNLGNKFLFIVQSENDLQDNFIDLYKDIDEAKEFIDLVQSEKVIPYFGENVDPLSVPFDKWKNMFYKSNKFVSDSKEFFWGFIENVN